MKGELGAIETGPRRRALGLAASVTTVGVEVVAGWYLLDRRLADVAMVFLLGFVTLAVTFGYAASLTATVLSVLALDYFFTEPYLSFAVADARYVLTLGIMAFVATVISAQTERIRRASAARIQLAVERSRLAEEARRAVADAQNERTRSALLSSVSHDLRTPLAAILAAANALAERATGTQPEGRDESLQTIVSEARRLNGWSRNLLDVTSLEAGIVRARKEWRPIEETVGVVLARLDAQLVGRSVRIRISEGARMAAFDATLIEQVLVNLIENAVKYAPAPSPIEIVARSAAGGGVEIEVADSGPGVPAGRGAAIFEKFYRAAHTGIGMGLGLTICRGVIAAHEGRIWYEDRPGGGASFRFLLPGGRTTPVADLNET
jgi:K+-sensing histidine kinase KdpD